MSRTILACLCALAASSAAAQEGGWSYAATGYAWLPGVTTTTDTAFGEVESSISAADALSSLEFGFMGAVEARRDRWGLIGDLIYTDTSTSSSTPGGHLFSKGTVDTQFTVLTGYAAYRVAQSDQASFDIAAGFRLFSTDIDGKLKGELLETRTFGGSETWVVPLIGARAILPIAERWTATLVGDVGGTGSDEMTWQAMASVSYAFRENWSAVLAYRYLSVEKPVGGNDTTIELYGPALGVTYRF